MDVVRSGSRESLIKRSELSGDEEEESLLRPQQQQQQQPHIEPEIRIIDNPR